MLKLSSTTKIQSISTQEYNRLNLLKGKEIYKSIRQRSKTVTFALQYGGQANTLVKNSGFTQLEANKIVSNYKKLFYVSEQEKEDHIKQASIDGYVTGAFGLRVRTPIIRQCVLGLRVTPKEAEAEKRTATNARFQSFGLLNSRAGVEFNEKVRMSKFKCLIRPVAQIHDAQYFLIKDEADALLFANKNLVKAVSWQDDSAIKNEKVKLGGEFSIFYPNWSKECIIPNKVNSYDELSLVINKYLKECK